MSPLSKVLVVGATGKQGGSVIDTLLLNQKVLIRGLSRSTDSPAAKALTSKGVEVVQGSFEDKASLVSALQGLSSAFLVTTPLGPGGTEQEEADGKLFIDAAKEANLPHLVLSSVDGAERSSGVPHFESKFAIEEYLRVSGIKHTILRPVAFMENLRSPKEGLPMPVIVFESSLNGKPLQMVSTKDIGIFAARALEDPQSFEGRVISLTGDELTMAQVAALYGIQDWKAPEPAFNLENLPYDNRTMIKWFASHGYKADIEANRKENPGMLSFAEWLRSERGV